MLNEGNKKLLRSICVILLLNLCIRPVIKAWHWREDEFTLFELSQQMTNNKTDFYQWLGVQPTSSLAEISKAHRELVIKWHPDSSTEVDAKDKFAITNQVGYILRTPKLKTLYDSILLENSGKIPRWKGFYYFYTHHKLFCMILLVISALTMLEYMKAWDTYMSEKLTFDQFTNNAKKMAQQISAKHMTAKTHNSFIDLGDKTIRCEITPSKEIFIFNEFNERVPLSASNLLKKPSIFNCFFLRLPSLIYDKINKSSP